MALILSLETSAHNCSVALHSNGQLLSNESVAEPQAHASKLAYLIQSVLSKASVSIHELEAVAITSGPGSYTGLRIGTSTAKGLCYSLAVPLVAVNTLELLLHQGLTLSEKENLLCPMIDARRMEVYCTIADTNSTIIQPIEAKVIDENSFEDLLDKNRIVFYGDGAAKCKATLTHPNALFIDHITPSAIALGQRATEKLKQAQVEDIIHFEPFYLKDFQAKKSSKALF
jgi:tRNA threonylcarbamoyladenosine biosynthesis protein TsaB